jgi:hypothetical protein
MDGGNGQAGQVPEDQTKKEETPQPSPPDNFDETVAPNQPQSELVLRKLRDLLEKDEITPELEKDMEMSRSEMEQFVRKYERKETEAAGPGRTIEAKPGEEKADDKPSTGFGGIRRNTPFSTRTDRGGKSLPEDQVRGNVEGVRVQVPPELRGKFDRYIKNLSRSRRGPTRPPQSGGALNPGQN